MMQIKLYCLALLPLLGSSVVSASDVNQFTEGDEFADFYGDEELVSIATGTSTPLRTAPSVASVITADDIEAMAATHLDEVLERIPGLHVMRSDLSRLDPVYSVRGIQTGLNPQILVLMNGTEIKDQSTGGLVVSFRMPVGNISRIEVIRGPGSAVYGADAFSGVINIITKDAIENTDGEVGSRIGSFGSRDLWVRKAYVRDDFSVNFSLETQTSDGDTGRVIGSDAQTALDQLFSTQASLAPGPLSTDYDITNVHLDMKLGAWSFENWFWDLDHGGLGQGGARALDNTGYQDSSQQLSRLSYDRDIADTFKVSSALSYQRTETNSFFVLFPAGSKLRIGTDGNAVFDPAAPIVEFPDGYIGNPRLSAEETKVEFSGLYYGIQDHSIRLATGASLSELSTEEYKNFGPGVIDGTAPVVDGTLKNVTGTSDIYLKDQERKAYFVSLQDQWQVNHDWSFTAGVRWDHFEDFGNTTNPRLALVWETMHNLTTKLMYGEAFRAPSFGEQHLINNPSAVGNPDLKPEEIKTWELAFDYRPNFDTNLKLSLFNYKATDLIATVAVGTNQEYQNARNQNGYGMEVEFDWRPTDRFSLYGTYAFQRAEDSDSGREIASAPSHTTYLDLRYQLRADWSASLQHYWIDERSREQGDSRPDIDDYQLVNMKVGRNFYQDQLSISLIVKNLFDADAREPSNSAIPDDYPLEGRSVWGEVRYRF